MAAQRWGRGSPYILGVSGLEFDHLWVIAFEVSGINNGLFEGPFGAELYDNPIDMIASSAPTSFPPISHVYASSGEKEVTRLSEVLVTKRDG